MKSTAETVRVNSPRAGQGYRPQRDPNTVICVPIDDVEDYGPNAAVLLTQIRYEAKRFGGLVRHTDRDWANLTGLAPHTVRRAKTALLEAEAITVEPDRSITPTSPSRPRSPYIAAISISDVEIHGARDAVVLTQILYWTEIRKRLSYDDIAQFAGMRYRTIRSAVARLVECGRGSDEPDRYGVRREEAGLRASERK